MAAPIATAEAVQTVFNFGLYRKQFSFFLCCCLLCRYLSTINATLFTFRPEDVLQVVSSSCLVALPTNVDVSKKTVQLFNTLADVSFKNEPLVVIGRVNTSSFLWPNGKCLDVEEIPSTGCRSNISETSNANEPLIILLFKRIIKDRKCLLLPKNTILPKISTYYLQSGTSHDSEIKDLVQFINDKCDTFRLKDGNLSYKGMHRMYILENLYLLKKDDNEFIENFSLSCESPIQTFFNKSIINSRFSNKFCPAKSGSISPSFETEGYKDKISIKTQFCDKISMPSTQEFLHEFAFKSKPVIIQGACKHWPAQRKWTNEHLRQMYGEQVVHVKLTPSGEFEGVENVSLWQNEYKIKIPEEILHKLHYPDLVVVRPATIEIKFSKLLEMIEDIATKRITNLSVYLEYSSVKDYFPELIDDLEEIVLFKNILHLQHINMWLSDGHTVGKLHFDPFDNFMCQVSKAIFSFFKIFCLI